MADWILVPCLVRLRAEFNLIAADRDRASDGTIGDQAHAGRVSDHNPDETGAVPIRDADGTNEVHALDIDADLRTPGLSMEAVIQHLLARCRSGAETRLRYIIYNRRIWEASNGWRQRDYTGDSPHTGHAHFSASYDTSREASTASWHLEDLVSLTADDRNDVRDIVREEVARGWTSAITTGGGSRDGGMSTLLARTGLTANSQLPAVLAKLDVDQVDEAAIAAAVLAGLTPEVFAAAMQAAGLSPQALAALIPAAIRREVADELRDRLES